MKKYLMLLLGAIVVIGCIGLTACGGSSEEEQATEETTEAATEQATEENTESAERTEFWGGYGYMGEDPVEGAVYEYMATEVAKEYDVDEDTISIPAVYIIDKVENEDGSVDVTGDFQIFNYKVDGETLVCQSGGDHPGKMHLVPDGDYYKVESFDPVGDGSEFEPTAKKIFGDKYDEFMKINSDDKTMVAARTQAVKDYVQATGIKVTQYQDEGWDPVVL